MKASYFGPMGYANRHEFPATWPIPPAYHDARISVQSYQEGMEECEFAEEMGFDWISLSEHHYSGRIATGNPAVMAAAEIAGLDEIYRIVSRDDPDRLTRQLVFEAMTAGRGARRRAGPRGAVFWNGGRIL